jgi:hypothetical protein
VSFVAIHTTNQNHRTETETANKPAACRRWALGLGVGPLGLGLGARGSGTQKFDEQLVAKPKTPMLYLDKWRKKKLD